MHTHERSHRPAIESRGQLARRDLALDLVALNAETRTRRNEGRLRGVGQNHNRGLSGFRTGPQGSEHHDTVSFGELEVEQDPVDTRADGESMAFSPSWANRT